MTPRQDTKAGNLLLRSLLWRRYALLLVLGDRRRVLREPDCWVVTDHEGRRLGSIPHVLVDALLRQRPRLCRVDEREVRYNGGPALADMLIITDYGLDCLRAALEARGLTVDQLVTPGAVRELREGP